MNWEVYIQYPILQFTVSITKLNPNMNQSMDQNLSNQIHSPTKENYYFQKKLLHQPVDLLLTGELTTFDNSNFLYKLLHL